MGWYCLCMYLIPLQPLHSAGTWRIILIYQTHHHQLPSPMVRHHCPPSLQHRCNHNSSTKTWNTGVMLYHEQWQTNNIYNVYILCVYSILCLALITDHSNSACCYHVYRILSENYIIKNKYLIRNYVDSTSQQPIQHWTNIVCRDVYVSYYCAILFERWC